MSLPNPFANLRRSSKVSLLLISYVASLITPDSIDTLFPIGPTTMLSPDLNPLEKLYFPKTKTSYMSNVSITLPDLIKLISL